MADDFAITDLSGGDTGVDVMDPEPAEPQDNELDLGDEPAPGTEGDEPEPEPEPESRVESAKPGETEPLPKELAKSLRELRQANTDNPAHLKTLNALKNSFYSDRQYRQIYETPEEAATDRAALQALGGHEGIANMQTELRNIEEFDNMVRDGDPRSITSLREQFPEGFKKLVPVALDELQKMDFNTFKETMRGPLLQILEGDGLMEGVRGAMEWIQSGLAKPEEMQMAVKYALRTLSQIDGWYKGLSDQEKQFKNRFQDPRLHQLEAREKETATRETNLRRDTYLRGVSEYMTTTLTPEIRTALNGKQLGPETRNLFRSNVVQEIQKNLVSNQRFTSNVKALLARGDVDGATTFAKPFVDAARKTALAKVATAMNVAAFPSARRNGAVRPAAPSQASARPGQPRKEPITNQRPAPIMRKPSMAELDMDYPNAEVMMIAGQGILKRTGQLVQWRKNA